MPIPVDYFQPLSFQQANPLLAGIQAGQNIFSQGVQNAYAPQTLAAQLQHALLQNQNLGITNQYLPQNLQTQIALRQAQTGETGAQTGLINQQTQNAKNFPVQEGVAGQMAYLDYVAKTQGTNSPSYILGKQLLDAQMARENAMAAYYGSNVQLKNLPTQEKHAIIGQGLPIGGVTTAAGMQPNGQVNLQTGGNNLNNPLVQKTAQVSANQSLTTNAQKNRLQAGQALENFLAQPGQVNALNTLAQYSGVEGRLRAQMERVNNPSAYLAYQNANEQLPTIIAGGLKVLEGYPSTDSSIQRVTNYFKGAQGLLKSDPAAAAQYIQQGLQFIRDENAAMQSVNQPIFNTGNIYRTPNQTAPKSSNAHNDPLGIR